MLEKNNLSPFFKIREFDAVRLELKRGALIVLIEHANWSSADKIQISGLAV
jgi:hypothetical protein